MEGFFRAKPLDLIAMLWSQLGELLENLGFIVAVGGREASMLAMLDVGFAQELKPQFAAAHGGLKPMSRRLANGPEHAEVADGSAEGTGVTIKDGDAFALASSDRSVGKADDAGADDDQVKFIVQFHS